MASSSPRVTVLTCVHNGERFLALAIESILGQTFSDFEYILVDDASTDGSGEIIARFAARDHRIVAVRSAVNVKSACARNLGLRDARGEYLAILDADDVAAPERLARQVAYLDQHPEVGLVGSQMRTIDETGESVRDMAFPPHPLISRWELFLGTPVLHSSATMRRALVTELGGYSAEYWSIDDYELFARICRVSQVTNLPECLAFYRTGPWQTSSVASTRQSWQAILLVQSLLRERLGLRTNLQDVATLYRAVRGIPASDEGSLRRTVELLQTMRARFVELDGVSEVDVPLINVDCARRLLVIAWTHRKAYREASREVLKPAIALDPLVLNRSWNRGVLRRLERRQAEAQAISPSIEPAEDPRPAFSEG